MSANKSFGFKAPSASGTSGGTGTGTSKFSFGGGGGASGGGGSSAGGTKFGFKGSGGGEGGTSGAGGSGGTSKFSFKGGGGGGGTASGGSTTTGGGGGGGSFSFNKKKEDDPGSSSSAISFGAKKTDDSSKPSFGSLSKATPKTTDLPSPPKGKDSVKSLTVVPPDPPSATPKSVIGFGSKSGGSTGDKSEGDEKKEEAPKKGFGFNKTASSTSTTLAKTGTNETENNTSASTAQNTSTSGTVATTSVTTKDNPFSKMTLQELVTKWKAELEEDVINYHKQAERVKKWDEQLRDNQKVLNNLVDTVHRLYVDQDDIATNIQQISEFQDDLDRDLDELSEQVDKELEKCGDLQPDEALYAREQIYTRATDLDHHLTQMHSNLESIITDFNEARGGDEDNIKALDGASDVGKILKVLNVHNDSLSFIETKSRQLKHDSDALSRQMENMYSNTAAGAGRIGMGSYD